MKKLFTILTVFLFSVAISAPVYSAFNNDPVVVTVDDETPKKAEAKKKDKKSADCQAEAKKSGCEAKSGCESKKAKTCGDKGKK
jgi:hypothetical protein